MSKGRVGLVAVMLFMLGMIGTVEVASAKASVIRLEGSSRVETAVAVSKEAYRQADTVVLAGYHAEVDAFAGTLLADARKAPLLFTTQNKLSKETKAEINRLGAKNVIVLGGKNAVSKKVVQELEKQSTVTVLDGANREDTAKKIAEEVGGKVSHVFLAKGYGDLDAILTDALAIGPASAKEQMPVLLTLTDRIPKATTQALKELGVTQVTIIGGPGAVSKEVEASLRKKYSVDRIQGSNREATAVAVADRFFKGSDQAIVANGYGSPDALVGGYLGAKKDAPILFTQAHRTNRVTLDYIEEKVKQAFVLGGKNVVQNKVFTHVRDAVAYEYRGLSKEYYLEEIIAPEYEQTRGFSEGVAAVKKNGKWGYVNPLGETVIDFQYAIAHSFGEGKALVGKSDGKNNVKLGYINQMNHYTPLIYENGREVSNKKKYHEVNAHRDYVYYDDYLSVKVDGTTELIFDSWGDYYWQEKYSPYAVATEDMGANYSPAHSAHLEPKGVAFSRIEFEQVRPFNQGLAPVSIIDKKTGKEYWTFVDRDGKLWNGPKFYNFYVMGLHSSYTVFGDYSLASLMDEHGKRGAVNKDGVVVIPFEYDDLYIFWDGVAAFKRDGKYGFINVYNEEVIPAQYDSVSNFSHGVALVQNRNQFYLIDQKGRKIPGTLNISEEHYFLPGSSADESITRNPGEYIITKQHSKYGFQQIRKR